MIYFNLALDLIKLIVKLLLIKCNNLRSSLRISFENQTSKKSIIIGTGPSLINDINEIKNYKKDECDFFGVNFFANTETFFDLKPNYYFLADKLFGLKSLIKIIINYETTQLKDLRLLIGKLTFYVPNLVMIISNQDCIKIQILR